MKFSILLILAVALSCVRVVALGENQHCPGLLAQASRLSDLVGPHIENPLTDQEKEVLDVIYKTYRYLVALEGKHIYFVPGTKDVVADELAKHQDLVERYLAVYQSWEDYIEAIQTGKTVSDHDRNDYDEFALMAAKEISMLSAQLRADLNTREETPSTIDPERGQTAETWDKIPKTRIARQGFAKLPAAAQEIAKELVHAAWLDPFMGKKKVGYRANKIRFLHFSSAGEQYRIAYAFEDSVLTLIVHIDSHENFYDTNLDAYRN